MNLNFVMTVNLGLLAAAFFSALLMIDRMNRHTRGAVRWGVVLLLVGVVAEAVGYVYHWASWTDTLFFGGATMSLVANLRFPGVDGAAPYREWTAEQRWRSETKSNMYAYLVGALTLVGLVVAWATS